MSRPFHCLFSKTISAVKLLNYKVISSLKNRTYRSKLKKHQIGTEISLANGLEPTSYSIYYINLDSRIDRLQGLEANLEERKFPAVIRLSGVKKTNGALGCALSHIKALESFLNESTGELLIIVEDDCRFLINFSRLSELLTEFISNQKLCVFVICPSVQGLRIPISQNFDVSNNIQTTACYAVKRHFVPDLLANFRESVSKLEAGNHRNQAAIDIHWKKLQQRFLFAVPKERLAFQESSYSNIENRVVKYD
jgi:hypothetical protein